MLLAAAAALLLFAAIGGVFALSQNGNDSAERIVSNEGEDADPDGNDAIETESPQPQPAPGEVEPTPDVDSSEAAVPEPTSPASANAQPKPTVDPSIAALLEPAVPEGARLLATGPDGSRYYGVDEEAPCGPGTTTLLGQDPFSPSLVFDPFERPDTIGFVDALVVDEGGWAIITTNCNGSQNLWIGRTAADGILADADAPAIDFTAPVLLRRPIIDAARDLVVVSVAVIDLVAQTNSEFEAFEIPFATREWAGATDERSTPNTPEPGAAPNNARLLAHLPGYDVSFFGFAEPAFCGDADAGKVLAVSDDGSGGPAVVGPQVEAPIRELIVSPSESWGVIVAACSPNADAEIWPVMIQPPGLLFPMLDQGAASPEGTEAFAWTGAGLVSSWDAETVTLSNSTGAEAQIDVSTGAMSVQTQGATGDLRDAPAGLYPVVSGMSPDGKFEYWNAEHPTGATGCEGSSQALWVHNTNSGMWQPAFMDAPDQDLNIVGNVTWSPHDETVVFSLGCEAFGASVYSAERTGDGRLFAVKGQVIPGLYRGVVRGIDWVSPGIVDVTIERLDGSDAVPVRYDTFNNKFDQPHSWLVVNGLGSLSFDGSPTDGARSVLDPVFGPGVSSDADCPAGPNQIITWGGLRLVFQDDVLKGWVYEGSSGDQQELLTPSGVAIGMTESDMAAIYTGVTIAPRELTDTSEFYFTVEAGTMSGLIKGGIVSQLSAGDACSFV